jgi:hypothetical protein
MNQMHSHFPPHGHRMIASILLAEIVGYEDRPVFEQIQFTTLTRQLLDGVIAKTPDCDVSIIDREDSIALLFSADPQDCLALAKHLSETLQVDPRYAELPLRIGVNLGPITLIQEVSGATQVTGPGIDDAQRVARAGALREILMSRAYYSVLSRVTMDDGLLRHKAFISDEWDQSFAIYQIPKPSTALGKTDAPGANLAATPILPARHSRGRWSAIAAAALIIVGSAALLQSQRPQERQQAPLARPSEPIVAVKLQRKPPATPAADRVVTEPVLTTAAPLTAPAVAQIVAAVTFHRATEPVAHKPRPSPAKIARKAVARQPATLSLNIRPWGEVYVDGKKVGVTPPLHHIEVPSGTRQIVVRNANAPPFRATLEFQPNTLMQVSHRFD